VARAHSVWRTSVLTLGALTVVAGLASAQAPAVTDASDAMHVHDQTPTAPAAPRNPALPPDDESAKAVLEKSPRHGEYVDIQVPGQPTPLRSFVVYPERKGKAPVVIVIHEIYGLSEWIRGVADQLARDGFIAIAPDLLSGKGPNGGATDSLGSRDEITKAVRSLSREEIRAGLDAVRAYGAKLPASTGKSATIGFCFGGAVSFWYAAATPDLNAAVVYYGTSPDAAALASIKAPVLGLYGGKDERVNATIEPAVAEMKELGKPYTTHIYDGAGHGFLRQQGGQEGANMKATEQAWPATLAFLREHTK
jgi:carboxymethylenebutenolidase